MKTYLKMVFFLTLVLVISTGVAISQDVKTRMLERLPAIKALKVKGIVGETNTGYLEFVGAKKEGANIVNAENGDRKNVYEAIAKKEGVTIEIVGRRRALQIAQAAEKGEWLQDEEGKWYKK